MRITERQLDLVQTLANATGDVGRGAGWRTPMYVGGGDWSHHSATLRQLVRLGLIEGKKLHAMHCPNGTTWRRERDGSTTDGHPPYEGCRCKGSRTYRANRRTLQLDRFAV